MYLYVYMFTLRLDWYESPYMSFIISWISSRDMIPELSVSYKPNAKMARPSLLRVQMRKRWRTTWPSDVRVV